MTVKDDERHFEHLHDYVRHKCAKYADIIAAEEGENFYEWDAIDVVFWLELNGQIKEVEES